MQFGYVEMGPTWLTGLGRLAALFIFLALCLLAYFSISLMIRFGRLRRYSILFGQPLFAYLESGKWQGTSLASWPGIKRPEFTRVVEAVRGGLPGLSAIPLTSLIIQAWDHLAATFTRMAYHLRVLGWSACLVGLLGTLSELQYIFKGLVLVKNTNYWPLLGQMIEPVIGLQIFGLSVGLACLWVSSLAQSRLDWLRYNLSNRILASSIKKGDD
jgi:hypothetical protein